jgi:PAS domain-containing protein
MIGLTDFDLHAPEAAREFRAMEEKILSTGQALIDREELTVEASGVEKWILSTKVPIRNDKGEVFGLVGIARDITNRKNAETALRRLNRTLQTLSAADEALVRGSSEQQLLDEMCRIVVEVGGYRLAWIGFAENDAGKTMRLVAFAGERPEHLDSTRITWADTVLGWGPSGSAIRSGQAQVSLNFETDTRIAPWRKEMLECGFKSNIALPLKNGGRPFGCLTLYSGEVDAFGPEEIVLLEKLAADLSFGIYAWREHAGHERATSALQESLRATVEAVAMAVELRDAYTAGHQRHVAELGAAVAREIGLSEQQTEGIYFAALIHDVGKISIPAELLSKPVKLSPLELRMIQTHAQTGYDIIKGIKFPWPIGQIILQHHERLDGSGYPNHLKGEAILIEAKILAVADVIDAMMSHRPYRPALGLEVALDEIEAGKGRLYDPAAVEACVNLFRNKGFSF